MPPAQPTDQLALIDCEIVRLRTTSVQIIPFSSTGCRTWKSAELDCARRWAKWIGEEDLPQDPATEISAYESAAYTANPGIAYCSEIFRDD